MQLELLNADYLLNKAVEFMLLKQEFSPVGSLESSNCLSKTLSMGLFGTNCYFEQIDNFLVERSTIRRHSGKIRSYVGDPSSYLLNYLNNPTSDEFYRIRIEIFCLIFKVCVKLYTHTGFSFSSEKFCIQNDRKIRLYKTPKKEYVSIVPVESKPIFSWSRRLIRDILDSGVFGGAAKAKAAHVKRKQQMLVREVGNGNPNGEYKYVSSFPDHLSSVRDLTGKQTSENGLKSSSKDREATPFMSSISQDNIQLVRGLGAKNIPKSTKAVVSRDLLSEKLDYGSISNPFEQFLSQCQKIDDPCIRQRLERSSSNRQNHGNSCNNLTRQPIGNSMPSEVRHSSAEKAHHPTVKTSDSSGCQLQKGAKSKKLPLSVSSNLSEFSNPDSIEAEVKEQRRLLRIFEIHEEDLQEANKNKASLLSINSIAPVISVPQMVPILSPKKPAIVIDDIIHDFKIKPPIFSTERRLSQDSQEPLNEVPRQEHFQKKPNSEAFNPANLRQSAQPKKKTKKKGCDKHAAYNPKYKERIDTQYYVGNLKFYDQSTDFGFLTTYFDGNFHDIFAHKEELARARLLQSALTFHKTGEVLTVKFQIATYFGKYKQSKKAVNIERIEDPALSSAVH